jgi:eukaryotic-like serine/threonine-protein kinase
LTEQRTIFGPPVPQDPLVGKTLGGYRVVEPLGGGGMSQLYRGEEVASGKAVAIKVLSEGSDDPVGARRMVEEARAVIAVKHPCIIELFALGQLDDGRPYLVMELLEGRSLFELQEKLKGKLSVAQTLNVLDQLLAGLVAAHAAGIVHRDLKPENIFVDERPEGWKLKILDFGLALRTDEAGNESSRLTAMGSVVGTPQFMAPEQANGEGPMTDRTDVYALGAIAFVLLTGRELFGPGTLAQIMVRQIEEPAPALRPLAPEVPEALEALVLQMLEKPQEARPTAAEARARVQALLRPGAVSRTSSGPRQPKAAPPPKSKLPLLAGLGVLALALAVGGGLWLRARSKPQVLPTIDTSARAIPPAAPAVAPPVAPEPAAREPEPEPAPDTSHTWRCAQIQSVGKVKKAAGGNEASFEVRFAKGTPLVVSAEVPAAGKRKALDALDGVREAVLRCKLKRKKLVAAKTGESATRATSVDLSVE